MRDQCRPMTVLVSYISRTQSFQEKHHVNFHVHVSLKLLVSLDGRHIACSARTQGDRQTDGQTKFRIPRCACSPRVNDCTNHI